CALAAFVVGCPKEKTTSNPDAAGNKIVLTKPSDQTIKKGDTDKIKISVDRKGINEALEVTFTKLPKGVSLVEKEAKIAANESSATFTLKADPDAQPVTNHEATVTVKGGGVEVHSDFNVSVKDTK